MVACFGGIDKRLQLSYFWVTFDRFLEAIVCNVVSMASSENPYEVTSLSPSQDPRSLSPSRPFPAALNFGLRTFVNHFVAIFVVTAIVYGPLDILEAYFDYFVFDEDDFRSTYRLKRGMDNFVGIIATGAVLAIGSAAHRNEHISPWAALGEGLGAWGRLFWTRLIRGLLLLVALLALIFPVIYVGFRLMLVEAAVVAERKSGMDGIKRAWHLADGRFWLITLLTLVSYGALMLIAIPLFVPIVLFPAIDHWLLSAALSLIADYLRHIPTLVLLGVYFQAVEDESCLDILPSPKAAQEAKPWAFSENQRA